MKRVRMACLVGALALLCMACGVTSAQQSASTGAQQQPPGGSVRDAAGFLAQLRNAHATVSEGPQVQERFMTVSGLTYFVNGERVEVFEYTSPEAASADASRFDAVACMITTPNGTIDLDWPDSPHFYKSGRVIVLYVGTNPKMKQLLTSLLGGQFAGK